VATLSARLSDYFGVPLGHFGAGIADPGWSFGTWSAKGRGKCADQKYRCDSLDDILRLPVGELFRPDAALALWFPQYALHWVPEVFAAWGFEPRTLGTWAKRTVTGKKWFFGQGKILRSATEFYAIGVRGHPPVRSHSVRNLIVAPWCGHSRKPDQLHRDIEQLYDGPYIELFARRHFRNWHCWGDQLGEVKSVAAADADPRQERRGAAIARRVFRSAGYHGIDARDTGGARWSGTGHVLLRNTAIFDHLTPPKGKAAAAPAAPAPESIDRITTPRANAALTPVTVWQPVTPPDGKPPSLITGASPGGQAITLQVPIHAALAWAAGAGGALLAAADGLVFARNAAGQIVGVGAVMRGCG
jgi:N6-adenosine-specific RNA methylase IME4